MITIKWSPSIWQYGHYTYFEAIGHKVKYRDAGDRIMPNKQIPEDRLIDLSNKVGLLPKRSSETSHIIQEFANLYGVSKSTIYRRLRKRMKPNGLKRADCGTPRIARKAELERFCQIIAAMKIRSLPGHKLINN